MSPNMDTGDELYNTSCWHCNSHASSSHTTENEKCHQVSTMNELRQRQTCLPGVQLIWYKECNGWLAKTLSDDASKTQLQQTESQNTKWTSSSVFRPWLCKRNLFNLIEYVIINHRSDWILVTFDLDSYFHIFG